MVDPVKKTLPILATKSRWKWFADASTLGERAIGQFKHAG
jgi:hypothetical protein